MNFLSDNGCGNLGAVRATFADVAEGFGLLCGQDAVSAKFHALFSEHFGCGAVVVLMSVHGLRLALDSICAPLEAILPGRGPHQIPHIVYD